jgi:hypothetical protein
MKVFIVLEQNENTDYEFCGVYGNREKAEKRIDEIVAEFKTDIEKFYIEEYEV